MIRFVYSIEYFPNCPVHEGGINRGLKKAKTLDEILDFTLNNLNEYGVTDVIDVESDDEIMISYYTETHRFNGIGLFINNVLIKRTVDDGRGNLIWEDK
jgi:hypothetical protein